MSCQGAPQLVVRHALHARMLNILSRWPNRTPNPNPSPTPNPNPNPTSTAYTTPTEQLCYSTGAPQTRFAVSERCLSGTALKAVLRTSVLGV